MTDTNMMDIKRIERITQGKTTEIWLQDLEDFDWNKADILKWVSPERIKKAERLKNESAKKCAVGSEYLLNKVLFEKKQEGKLPKEMKEWPFPLSYEKNTWGAPCFPGNPLYFNWSHSGEYVVLAVSDHPVGVDIQKRKKYKLSIAEKYFPEIICEKLKQLSGNEQEVLFFRFWTLLEAWLKARGTGFHKFVRSDVTEVFSEKTGWKYHFYEKIEGYEVCLVEKLR